MSGELQLAIQSQADSDATLSDLVLQSGIVGGRGVWYGQCPDAIRAPWVTYYIISEIPNRVFDTAQDGEDAIVQFSIFDDGSNPETVWAIDAAIEDAFDRQELTYNSRNAVMCMKESAVGPDRVEDGWLRTVDYRIINHT